MALRRLFLARPAAPGRQVAGGKPLIDFLTYYYKRGTEP
jgi:hypothetical protein